MIAFGTNDEGEATHEWTSVEIEALDARGRELKVSYAWVRGHDGHAANEIVDALAQSADDAAPTDMSAYATAFRNSWAHADLYEVRNLRPSFNTALGIWGGIAYSGVDTLLLKGITKQQLVQNQADIEFHS